jgi:ribosomal protein L7/L12
VESIPRPLPPEAVAAIQRGSLIEAIKIVRERLGLDLKDSKDAVDAYLAAHPELRAQMNEQNAGAGARLLLALAGLVALGLLALLWLRAL